MIGRDSCENGKSSLVDKCKTEIRYFYVAILSRQETNDSLSLLETQVFNQETVYKQLTKTDNVLN